jgi:hypothetical protein
MMFFIVLFFYLTVHLKSNKGDHLHLNMYYKYINAFLGQLKCENH